jgi:hypothetical protein
MFVGPFDPNERVIWVEVRVFGLLAGKIVTIDGVQGLITVA